MEDTEELEEALIWAGRVSGRVMLDRGREYVVRRGPLVPPRTVLDLNGAILRMELERPDDTGVLLSDYSAVENGGVLAVSLGEPGAQGFFHTAISIGEPNDTRDTPQSPAPRQFVRGWRVSNVEVSTTRPRGPAIQIQGGAHGGVLENIEIPSGAQCSGIHLDWGDVGGVRSGGLAEIEETRRRFDLGECYSTHPHHIRISNVRVGRLPHPAGPPDLGTRAVRISACHDILVEDVQCAGVTAAALQVHGGDLGFEFARPLEKIAACRNIIVRGFYSRGSNCGAYVDTYADNIDRAAKEGYRPLLDPLMPGRIVLDGFTTHGLGGDSREDGHGIRVENADGVELVGCAATRHAWGILIGERNVNNCSVADERVWGNQRGGLRVDPPIVIRGGRGERTRTSVA